jgi:hypothetical protein
MDQRARLLVASVVSAVLFTAGYFIAVIVPGGGEVAPEDFTQFYAEEGNQFLTLLFAFLLLAGALALVWFFNELRTRLPDGLLPRVGYGAAVIGLVGLAAGGAVMVAPMGVQLNSDAEFVGVEIAHTFAQAGLGLILLVGMVSLALATLLFSLTFREGDAVPSWLAIGGIVVAVLMLGSYIWVPGLLFPIWVVAVGVVGLPERRRA